MATYLTYQIFDWEPEGNIRIALADDVIIKGEHHQAQVKHNDSLPERILEQIIRQEDAAEIKTFRDFYDARYGMTNPFWARSHKNDIELSTAVTASDANMKVVKSDEINGLVGLTRHIHIPSLDEDYKLDTANMTTVGSATQIPLDSTNHAGGFDSDIAIGTQIEFIYFVRFDMDYNVYFGDNVPNHTLSKLVMRELQRETE